MNILSLFDGISCSMVALKRSNIKIKNYYACEIDKHAIEVSKKNYPEIIHLGSVVGLTPPNNIDLLIGGSPCQDLSIAKKGRKGLNGERSGLFYEYVRIMKECNPKYFILENVNSMSKESKAKITEVMGVEPIMIDASLVSAQSRKRLFWTNIPVTKLPENKGILLKDILESDAEVDERMTSKGKAYTLTASYNNAVVNNSIEKKQRTMVKFTKSKEQFTPTTRKLGYVGDKDHQAPRVYDTEGKAPALNVVCNNGLIKIEDEFRKLTPIECERLQGLPDNYTEGISNTQRYKCLGNAFNVDVIVHILKFIE